jgi:hypothetical protein
MAAQEAEHLETFDRLIAEHRVRPTALSPIWHVAGYALGAATALMGEKAAMACTAAVEEVIDEKQMYVRQVAIISDERSLEGQQWLVRGVSTGGFAAGATITLPQTFEVTAAKTRRTAEGATQKVFVLEPIDVEPYLPKN